MISNNNSTTNILLIGHAGFYNRGCEAIVRGTVSILRKYFPNCNITLISLSDKQDKKKAEKDNNLTTINVPLVKGSRKPSLSWCWQTFNRRILHPGTPFNDFLARSYYKESDIVISIGGDNFSDDYGGPKPFFDSLRVARKYGAKTVIWGASIGPFSPSPKEQQWAKELKKCDLVTVRETSTLNYLKNLNVVDNVKLVADPAFLMEAVHPTESFKHEFFAHEPVIGIGMSDLLSRYGTSKAKYIRVFSAFIEYLFEKHSAKILLVPHVTETSEGLNDTSVCQEVIDAINGSGDIWLLPEHYNACEMKYCISKCNYFIGARTHSTIASLSSRVPTISIGYSIKAIGLNNDLLGSTNYVIPHEKLTLEHLIATFELMSEKENELRDLLKSTLPEVIEQSLDAGRHLNSIIKA